MMMHQNSSQGQPPPPPMMAMGMAPQQAGMYGATGAQQQNDCLTNSVGKRISFSNQGLL